jgi:hypothetical protein
MVVTLIVIIKTEKIQQVKDQIKQWWNTNYKENYQAVPPV